MIRFKKMRPLKAVTPSKVTPVTRREVTQDKRAKDAARQQAKRDRDRNMSFAETVAADG